MSNYKKEIMETCRVKSHHPLGLLDCYDLEVDSSHHNFYCNGLVVSNSHSISYATLSAQTVYLKFKYPAEFFLSILEIAHCFQEPLKIVEKINQELPKFGLELLPPNLEKSELDFTIEPNGIRYGLTSIRGISEKTFKALIDFRKSGFNTKYDLFLAAKKSGINIGVLSSLIFSGALGRENRSRLALEAQTFNLLTEREKRNFIKLSDRLGPDVLQAIHKVKEENIIGDDNKPVMKPSRFETFRKKFQKYKKLYSHNSKYEKFCAWWFEQHFLGYAYSYQLKDCFADQYSSLVDVAEIEKLTPFESFRCVGVVNDDVFIKTSQNGNRYTRFNLTDTSGSQMFLFCDSSRRASLSLFLENNALNKNDIAVVSGSAGRDGTPFINEVHKIDTKIFTNTRQIKDENN